MTETPEPRTEPTAVDTAPPGSAYRNAPVAGPYRHSRLNTVLAWVGIVAGIVFIVAVVFFSGFVLGRHAGGGHGGGHHHHWNGSSQHGGWGRHGGAGGPGAGGPGGGPGGPGQYGGGAGGPGAGGSPSPTTSPSTPHP